MKILKWVILVPVILFLGYFSLFMVILLGGMGDMPFTKCGPGFGSSHNQERVKHIKKEFDGAFPENIEIISFKCVHVMNPDPIFKAEFLVDQGEVGALVSTMENNYLNDNPKDEGHTFFLMADKDKKEAADSDFEYVEYTLPSYGGYYHVKNVSVRIPKNNNKKAIVYIYAYSM